MGKKTKSDLRKKELEAENRRLKIELLDIAAWIFSYSETSQLASNSLFYDLWLRYGFKAAEATGMFADWKDRRVMFEAVREEMQKLRAIRDEVQP